MHLDSPFSGVGYSKGEKLRAGLRTLFCGIMELAADYDAVLIAGDLFDCSYISSDTADAVRSSIEKYAKPVIIAPGNHDPYSQGSVWTSVNWPENCRIFSDDRLSHFDFDTDGGPVTVWGWAFTSDRMDDSPLKYGIKPIKGRLNIILGHCDFNSPITRYCPVTAAEIAGSGCAYAAFGHIHKLPEAVFSGRTLVSYCGFPQGRSWDEPGEGGVMAAEFDSEGNVSLYRIKTGNYRYEHVSADITGLGDDASVLAAVLPHIGPLTEASVRLTLEGAVPPEYVPDEKRLAEGIEKSLPGISAEVIDRTLPVYGAGYLENDMTVRGEFYRSLLPMLTSDDAEMRSTAADALRYGLLALSDRPF